MFLTLYTHSWVGPGWQIGSFPGSLFLSCDTDSLRVQYLPVPALHHPEDLVRAKGTNANMKLMLLVNKQYTV